jgi:hypothetical protein
MGGRWAIAVGDAVRGLSGDSLPDSLSSAESAIDNSLDGSSGLSQPCEFESSRSIPSLASLVGSVVSQTDLWVGLRGRSHTT